MGLGGFNQFGSPFGGSLLGSRDAFLAPPAKSRLHRAFETCLSRIELDPTRVAEASQHYNAVKDWLENNSDVTVRQTGSFKRKTKIRPSTDEGVVSPIDIDAIACFGEARRFAPPYTGGMTPNDALEKIRRTLSFNKTYRLLDPEIDHPVVTLSYANEFFIELVPCYKDRFPGNEYREPASYLVADKSGAWLEADYDFDSQYITAANKACGGNLVPAIKLIKRFVRNKQLGLKSFQIEIVCAELLPLFFNASAADDWEWQDVLQCFFKFGPALLANHLQIPGSKTPPIKLENPLLINSVFPDYEEIVKGLDQLPDSEMLRLGRAFYGKPFPIAL